MADTSQRSLARRARPISALVIIGLAVAACSPGTPATTPPSAPAVAPSPVPTLISEAGDRTRIVVSTDLGISDMLAITFLAARDDVVLAAIAVAGNGFAHCPVAGRNAGRLLKELGRPDVPVGCGPDAGLTTGAISFPEGLRAASDDAFGADLARISDATAADAAEVMTTALETSPEPVTLLILGPATTLGQVLQRDASLAARIDRIVWIGGAFDVPGTAGPDFEGAAEWNMAFDPVAAGIVLATGIPITLVPLDATDDVPITKAFFERLAAGAGSGPANLAWELLWRQASIIGSADFWDPLTAVASVEPAVLRVEPTAIRILEAGSEAGRTLRDAAGRTVDLAVTANPAAFEDAFLRDLQAGAPRPNVFVEPAVVGEIRVAYLGDAVAAVDAVEDGGPGGYRLVVENRSKVLAGCGIVRLVEGATPAQLRAWIVANGLLNPGLPPAELATWINGVDAPVGETADFLLDLSAGTHTAVCSPWEGADATAVYVSDATFVISN